MVNSHREEVYIEYQNWSDFFEILYEYNPRQLFSKQILIKTTFMFRNKLFLNVMVWETHG